MHVTTKVKRWIYAWYVAVAALIGVWAGTTFRAYADDSYEVSTFSWKAFAIGASVTALLTLPLPLFAMLLDRRRKERDLQREQDDVRHVALVAKIVAVMTATGAVLPDGEDRHGGEVAPSGEAASPGSDSGEAFEFESVDVVPQARSPYEPPQER